MKQITQREVEALMEKLATKGTRLYCNNCSRGVVKHECNLCVYTRLPIIIGDVLEKIDRTVGGRNYYAGQNTYNDELIHLWSRCGELTQSLQEIVEESGWEKKYHIIDGKFPTERYTMGLKSDDANALFNLLTDIAL